LEYSVISNLAVCAVEYHARNYPVDKLAERIITDSYIQLCT